jgi:hypothetical protein
LIGDGNDSTHKLLYINNLQSTTAYWSYDPVHYIRTVRLPALRIRDDQRPVNVFVT